MKKLVFLLFVVLFPISIAIAADNFDALPQGDSATTDPALDDQPPAAPSIAAETSTTSARSSTASTSSAQTTQSGPEYYLIFIVVAVIAVIGIIALRRKSKSEL